MYLSDGHPTLWNPTLYPYARLKHRSKIKADHVDPDNDILWLTGHPGDRL